MENFIKSDYDLRFGSIFDIGIIVETNNGVIQNSSSKKTSSTDNIPNRAFTIQLLTSSGVLRNVQTFGEGASLQQEVTTYIKNSMVLVGYIGTGKLPFILKSMSSSAVNSLIGNKNIGSTTLPLPPGSNAVVSSSGAHNIVTGDGQNISKGGTTTVSLGEKQPVNSVTNKQNIYSVGSDSTGEVISIDEEGNIVRTTSNSDIKNVGKEDHTIASDSNTAVGEDYNLTTGRTNIDSLPAKVSDIDSKLLPNQANKDGLIALGNKDSILKGDAENAILGQQFQTAFGDFLDDFINKPIGTANGSPVILSPIFAQALFKLQTNLPKMLSRKTFLEKDNEVS